MNGLEVKEFRKKLRFTQKEFAELLSVSTETVKSWEYGKRNMPDSKVELLRFKTKSENGHSTLNEPELDYLKNKKTITYYPDIVATNSNVEINEQFEISNAEKIEIYSPNLEGSDFALRNYGNSNYPKIQSGDIVGYRNINFTSIDSLDLNRIYLIITCNNQRFNKKLQIHKTDKNKLWCISINKDAYPPHTILKEDILYLYEVVGYERRDGI